ncbi:MAG: acyl-CoA/acyl-ACP dehydrogenase [Deltaproteobacteria bacterium]|nr:acyl-CoA/acyl-ACP dehydrogenase [Deltaproteobacteria bacterium]MBW2724124.1 acyl-CoA/acyl-ACP dehydrogenase [Deltaproteobacteria bacterium]
MDVHLSEEQESLRTAARDFLDSECPIDWVRKQMDDPKDVGGPLWKKMAELGWLGLTVPEEHGGAELDLLSLAILCQEMGRALLPEPYLSTVAVGTTAILLAGNDDQKRKLLPEIAEGRLKIALAQLEDSLDWGAEGIALTAKFEREMWSVDGTKQFSSDARHADILVVPVRTSGSGESGVTLFLIEADAPGIEIDPVSYTDQTRGVCEVRLTDVRVAAEAVLGSVDDGWSLLQRSLDTAKVALCAEMLGGAERVHELSVAYAKQREQFGKPIGSFQAIQHKCANQFIQVEGMRSAVYYAAWAVENDEPDAHLSACLAKSFCGDAYAAVAGEGIQIHGGLGFTWEQDLHLFYKRAKASQLLFGDGRFNRELAAKVLLD